MSQSGNGAIEVSRVPQDDCGDEEVQAGSAVLLVLIGAVADLSEAMDEDGPRQAVTDMICWPVSARVGNVKNNELSLIEPIGVQ
jgi:hypothetical protein